jgi:2'-hydroxyisoflavone reductase
VGRSVVDEGLGRGWDVTTFNRGNNPAAGPEVRQVTGDRFDRASVEQLSAHSWDLVVHTWSGAPRAVLDSATVLADDAARYVYISSASVYAPPVPLGVHERSPTVSASPDAEAGEYPELKRGAELAVTQTFGERALLGRAGLILGPHEDVGRLTWWLNRIAAGGEVLAPGPPDMPIQFVDARDLAIFVLDAALAARNGPYNIVSRPGHATMRSLLETCQTVAGCADTQLTWVDPATIEAAAIEAWTELPIWLPPDSPSIAMHAADVEHAHATGLRCRPIRETVNGTWQWLSARSGRAPLRPDLDPTGLDSSRERAALAMWHAIK